MKTVSYSGRVKDLLHSGNILVCRERNNKFPICDYGVRPATVPARRDCGGQAAHGETPATGGQASTRFARSG